MKKFPIYFCLVYYRKGDIGEIQETRKNLTNKCYWF
jgi:hypothetical protein